MKKTNAFIAAVLTASMLTSCGGTDTAEITSAESTVSETTAATVSETDTLSAESEETTTEATEKETAEEPIDEPVTETDDLEDEPVRDDEPEPPDETDFLASKGIYENISPFKFTEAKQNDVPKEVLDAAVKVVENAGIERYKNFISYNPEQTPEERAAEGKPTFSNYEDFLVNGEPELKVAQTFYYDFDQNGTKEAFIVLELPWYNGDIPYSDDPKSMCVFVNSSLEAELIQRDGYIDGFFEYDGFTHVNMSYDHYFDTIFLVKDDQAVKAFEYGWTINIIDEENFFIANQQVFQDEVGAYYWSSEKEIYEEFIVTKEEAIDYFRRLL